MSEEKIEWDYLDTNVLYMPDEIIVYHLYRRELLKKLKKEKDVLMEEKIIKSYLTKTKNMEVTHDV